MFQQRAKMEIFQNSDSLFSQHSSPSQVMRAADASTVQFAVNVQSAEVTYMTLTDPQIPPSIPTM